MDITYFINKKTGEENQLARFQKMISKQKTKQDLRNLEMHLLRPKPIPVYKGKRTGRTDFQKRTILFTFPDKLQIDRLAKFFAINTYIQNNIYDVEFLMELIRLMEKKRIAWDKTKKRFYYRNKIGKKIKL